MRDVIIGGNQGNGFFDIRPENISSTGFWSIQANSPNYFNGHYFGEIGTFVPNASYGVGSAVELKLNLTQTGGGVPLNILESLAICNVFLPNGSLFWTGSAAPNEQGITTFPVLWLGSQNTSIGQYSTHVTWTNGTSVAANVTSFVVVHQTRLNVILPANYQSGEPLPTSYSSSIAIRVELEDLESKTLISGANLTLRFDNTVNSFTEITPGTYDITVDSSRFTRTGYLQLHHTH